MKLDSFLVLKPTEERVFSLLQKHSSLSISEISKRLSLSRTSIYNSLESLQDKNIIFKNCFLYSLQDSKLAEYHFNDVDVFKKISNLLNELTELKMGEIVYSIETDAEIKALFGNKNELMKWQKSIADKGVVLKGIASTDALIFLKNKTNPIEQTIFKERSGSARFSSESLPGNCTLVVFRNTTVFMSRSEKYFYRINNAFVSEFIRQIFDKIYLGLEYKKLV